MWLPGWQEGCAPWSGYVPWKQTVARYCFQVKGEGAVGQSCWGFTMHVLQVQVCSSCGGTVGVPKGLGAVPSPCASVLCLAVPLLPCVCGSA